MRRPPPPRPSRLRWCASGPSNLVTDCYFPSLSARTLVYKGMLTATQVSEFLSRALRPTARERACACALSLYSTTRSRAGHWPIRTAISPQRRDQHRGREPQRMRAREALLATGRPPRSDRAILRSAHRGQRLGVVRRSARTAASRRSNAAPRSVDDDPRGLGEPRPDGRAPARLLPLPDSALMEPWDGPAAVAFTDGTLIGRSATQRPAPRPYWVTSTGLVVLASESACSIRAFDRRAQGPPPAGRMFLVDTAKGRIVDDDEIKSGLASEHPVRTMADPPADQARAAADARHADPQHASLVTHQRLFGYTKRTADHLGPMARTGAEPMARWARTPPSRCSRTARGSSTTTSPSSSPR